MWQPITVNWQPSPYSLRSVTDVGEFELFCWSLSVLAIVTMETKLWSCCLFTTYGNSFIVFMACQEVQSAILILKTEWWWLEEIRGEPTLQSGCLGSIYQNTKQKGNNNWITAKHNMRMVWHRNRQVQVTNQTQSAAVKNKQSSWAKNVSVWRAWAQILRATAISPMHTGSVMKRQYGRKTNSLRMREVLAPPISWRQPRRPYSLRARNGRYGCSGHRPLLHWQEQHEQLTWRCFE